MANFDLFDLSLVPTSSAAQSCSERLRDFSEKCSAAKISQNNNKHLILRRSCISYFKE
jgi:hypothetical protein